MKKIVLPMLALVIATVAMAEGVTPQQALEQARSFMQKREAAGSRMRKAPGAVTQLTLERQVSGLYVFNVAGDGGYVIVSNDDRTTPILGFSDSGHVDADNMPDNMRAWLQGYADQIAWLQQHPAATDAKARGQRRVGTHSTTAIGKLLTTTWNQSTPYNNLCPEYQTGHRSVTGCVATAMAQVMNYHEWPKSPTTTTAIPGYTTDSYNISMAALSATSFDWANMANSYKGETTDAQKTAVATLMRYCGQSVRMNYGPSSGASISDVATALKTYFGYNTTTTQYVSRSFYTYANWVDLIYHELEQRRPVLYGGQSSGGGHAFVCDGYKYENSTDYFHINWGWGGKSDEFFVLSALNPKEQGTGGSESADGYNFGQEAVVGIQKPDGEGTVLNVASTVNLTINSITLSDNSVAHGATVTVTVNVTNNSDNVYDGELSLVINDRLGNGKMFEIAAKSSANCSFEYTPAAAGTYIFKCAKPTVSGGYSWGNNPSATLKVDDQTPSDLVASDVTLTTATIGWTSDATKWNLRSRPLTITEVDFSDGLPSGWTGQAQGGNYWIISPAITLGGSISLWAGGEGFTGDFHVSVQTGESTYTQLSSFTATSTRKEYTADLSGYSGTARVAIILSATNSNTVDVDNITIVEPGSWTTYNNLTAKSQTLEGLTPETHYEVQVQAIINENPTDWSEPLVFSTPNITPTNLAATPTNQSALISWTNGSSETKWNVRYYQRDATKTTYDFESGCQNWAIGESDDDGKNFVWSSNFGRNGSSCLRSASVDESGVLSPQNNLFSPLFTLGGTLSFWVRGLEPAAAAERFRIYLLDDKYYITDLLTDDIITTSEWTQYTINLRKYSGTGCVMFVHNTEGGQSSLCIDDIVITQPADDWITVNDVTSNPYMLTGLSAASTYDVEVQAVISNTITSNWSRTLTFTTTATAAFELTDNSKANSGVIAAWNGRQATVTLAGRTLYKDGEWNTICLPFNVTLAGSPLADATAKTLTSATMSGTTVGLTFGGAVSELVAGTPYIIKWDNDTEHPTLTESDLVFNDVTIDKTDRSILNADGGNHVQFIGYYDAKDITAADDDIYYMTTGNTLKHTGVARTLNACRAYFQFSENAKARQFVLDFGDDSSDATRLINNEELIINNEAGAWYTIDGMKLSGKPTRKGVYIKNGKLVVIK